MKHLSLRTQLLALMFVPSLAAGAQAISANVVVIDASHYLLGAPLIGVGVTRHSRLSLRQAWRISAEYAAGNGKRTGSTCTDGIFSAPCTDEPLRDSERVGMASVGLEQVIVGSQHANLSFTGDGTVATLRVLTRGQSSGDELASNTVTWGGMVGIQAAWRPRTIPVGLRAAFSVGHLAGDVVNVSDGYTPYSSGLGFRRFSVSIDW